MTPRADSEKNNKYIKKIKFILLDKIARPHRKLFGLLYALETSFSAESFYP